MIKEEKSRQPNRKPHSFFLRDVIPVPKNASPAIGNNMA